MFQLLADTGITATQWVLLGLILVLIILYPVFSVYKNKKEKENFDKLATSLKVGDKVLTSSGVYGQIVAITEQEQGKLVTLKTGIEEFVGYISVDILAIYTVFREKDAETLNTEEVEQKTEIADDVTEEVEQETEIAEEVTEEVVGNAQETIAEEVVEEKPKK